jgi:hypothetical protein
LKDFEEKGKNNEWPSSTQTSCYWCCHRFEGPPVGIPLKVVDGRFFVYGCFCTLECAAAYNFNSHESMDEMWERYSLLNLLAHRLNPERGRIKVACAPNRLSLIQFGGHMTIDDFRQFGETGRFVNVSFPPMMAVTQQVEEVNEGDVCVEQKYVPIDTDRIQKYKEKVMLRRAKPLTGSSKNTLDSTMNIRSILG